MTEHKHTLISSIIKPQHRRSSARMMESLFLRSCWSSVGTTLELRLSEWSSPVVDAVWDDCRIHSLLCPRRFQGVRTEYNSYQPPIVRGLVRPSSSWCRFINCLWEKHYVYNGDIFCIARRQKRTQLFEIKEEHLSDIYVHCTLWLQYRKEVHPNTHRR